MPAKTTAPKTAPAKAAAAPAPAIPDTAQSKQDDTTARAKSAVTKDGTAKCQHCTETKPVTKFPTTRQTDGTQVRDTSECRACRDARRAAKKAAAA